MKKCLVIINSYNEEACKLTSKIESFLKKHQLLCEKIYFSGQKSVFSEYNKGERISLEEILCAITLGGDGTVLFAARFCSLHDIPIFPINLGTFGFIAGVSASSWQKDFEDYLEGKMSVLQRSMVKIELYRDDEKIFYSNALNDIAVTSSGKARSVSLDVCLNGDKLGIFKSDGFIVSTATGSTAYSAAAGGPIVDPAVDALIMTTLCSYSLSARPLVLPPWSDISIKVLPSRGAEVSITCDGQVFFDAIVGDELRICKDSQAVTLVGCDSGKFYGALRSKLNWSGGSRA